MASQRIFQAIHTPHSLDAQRGNAQRTYTRHHPEESILYDVIQRELEPFVARAQAREQPVPRFVEQELQAFLRCGILAHGFLRLCRYVARPPLANERLEERPDGGLALRLKTRWRDGTSHILMERSELIDRLVPLIPPPRAHQVRYHGILAPCASRRDRVVPAGAADFAVAGCGPGSTPVPSIEPSSSAVPRGARTTLGEASTGIENADVRTESHPTASAAAVPKVDPQGHSPDRLTRRRYRWAQLLQRVFEIDALRCPRCGSTLRLIAAIEDPAVARRILECLKLPARSPPMQTASWAAIPPKPVAPDRGADWEFDQSRPAREDSDLS